MHSDDTRNLCVLFKEKLEEFCTKSEDLIYTMHRTSTNREADAKWISVLYTNQIIRGYLQLKQTLRFQFIDSYPILFPIILYSSHPYILTTLIACHAGRRWLRHNANASSSMR